MGDSVTSVSLAGFATENRIGEHRIQVDSREESGPKPVSTLLAAYASCFIVGLRLAAGDAGLPELGEVRIDVAGERDEDGDLADIEFELELERDLPPEDRDQIVARALSTCHVGNALRDDLEATVVPGGQ